MLPWQSLNGDSFFADLNLFSYLPKMEYFISGMLTISFERPSTGLSPVCMDAIFALVCIYISESLTIC